MTAFDAGIIEASLVIQRQQAQQDLNAILAQYEALKAKLSQGIDVPVRADIDEADLAKLAALRDAAGSSGGLGLVGSDEALLKKLEQEAANPGGIGIIGTGTDTTLTRLLRQQLEKQAQTGGLLPNVGTGQSGTDVDRAVQEVTQQVVSEAAAPAPVTQMVHEEVVGGEATGVPGEVTEQVHLDYGEAVAEAAVAGQEAGAAFDAGLDRSPLTDVSGVLGGLFRSVSGAPAADAGQAAGTSFSDGVADVIARGGAAAALGRPFTGPGEAGADAAAGTAGRAAGTAFSDGVADALAGAGVAGPLNRAFTGADAAALDAVAETAGEHAGTSFSGGVADALAGSTAVGALNRAFTGADADALDAAAGTAGDRAGTSFADGVGDAAAATANALGAAFTGPGAAGVNTAAATAGTKAGSAFSTGVENAVSGGGGGEGGGGIFGVLKKEFALFGGALADIPGLGEIKILSMVTGLHILLDSTLEFLAVMVPGTIALAAFGIAGVTAFKDIYEQMSNLNTAEAATGQMIPPLMGKFQALADSVRPEVYELFGDYMLIGSKNGNTFETMAYGVGQALDQLGARFAQAMLSKDVTDFAQTAVSDFSEFGTAVGNLGGVFGNLMKAMPGYAEILLAFGTDMLGVLETVTRVGEPIIAMGLALHGALVWGGLFATVLIRITQGLLGMASGGLLKAAVGISGLGSAGEAAGDGLLSAAAGAEALGALPWGWISIAVAGMVAMVFWLKSLKSATEEWVDSLEAAIMQSAAVQGATALMNSYVDVTNRLSTAQDQLNQRLSKASDLQGTVAGRMYISNQATAAQEEQVTQLSAAQQELQDQTNLYTYRLGVLANQFGGLTQAQGLLTVAGITTNDMLKSGSTVMLQLEDQLKALTLGYSAMGIAGGRLGAIENALNFTQAEQYTAVTKANTAASSYISTIVGGESAFVAFQQGIGQMSSDAKAAGASIGGLNANSLTLANDFYTTMIPAAQNVVNALNLQDVSTKNLTLVVATQAKELLTYAGNNTAARSAIVDLINNALGPSTVSLQTLNRWVGTNSGTLKQYQQVVNQAEEDTSNLAKAINAQLTTSFANDVVQASGASGALRAYTQDLLNNEGATNAGHSARQQLINDLERAGLTATQASNYVDGLTRSLHQVPGSVNTQVTFGGGGTVSVSAAEKDVIAHIEGGFASGGKIMAGTGPTADDVVVLASKDETILSASQSRFLAPLLKAMGVPGYQGGGSIGSQIQGLDSNVQNTAMAGMDQLVIQQVTAALQQLIPPSGVSAATFDQIENWWTGAGGPAAVQRTAAAITGAESSFNVDAVQQGLPYACVPLETRILTRRGWLNHNQVQPGDITIGYNPETGRSEWTKITAVHHYGDAEVWRIGNNRWHADVTPGHRWWSDTECEVGAVSYSECPEWGWLPRLGIKRAGQAVSLHRKRIHGITAMTCVTAFRGEFVTTESLGSHHRIRLAAPADTDGIPGLMLDECAIVGWLMGDGHIHRNGNGRSLDARIYQSKPEQVERLRALLAGVPHTERIRQRGGNRMPTHEFRLGHGYASDLLKRARWSDLTPAQFVLAISPGQRAAWLAAMIDAEGNSIKDHLAGQRGPRRGARPGPGTFTRIAQADGPVQDAITLAVYLEGWRPSRSRVRPYPRDPWKPAATIGMCRPHVTAGRSYVVTKLRNQPVYCVSTVLGTWTMMQYEVPVLTGNSTGWGLWQITPGNSEPQFGINEQLLNGPANAGAAVAKYRGAGDSFSPWTTYEDGAYLKFLDRGGWLEPGATIAVNHTGRPEAVTPASTIDQLGTKLDKIAGLLADLGTTARRAPARTADGVSQALGGVARGATYRALYSPRG